MKKIMYRVKDLGINRSYGFVQGSYVIVEAVYKNGRKTNFEDIRFGWNKGDHPAENLAKKYGIYSEDELHKLIGKKVEVDEYFEEYDGELYLVYDLEDGIWREWILEESEV